MAGGGVAAAARRGRVPAGGGDRSGRGPGWEDLPAGEQGTLATADLPTSLHTRVPCCLVTPHIHTWFCAF